MIHYSVLFSGQNTLSDHTKYIEREEALESKTESKSFLKVLICSWRSFFPFLLGCKKKFDIRGQRYTVSEHPDTIHTTESDV